MKKLISSGRLIGGGIVLALLLVLYFSVLFKLQVIEGAKYAAESANNRVTEETVASSRGNFLDRCGRLLVSSRTCYDIVINTDELFEQEDPNAVILELIDTVEEFGQTYIDELPITSQSPFEYTEKITARQQAVLDGYIQNACTNSMYTQLALDTGIAKVNPNPQSDEDPKYVKDDEVTAVELMAFFRSRYGIGAGYDNEQTRKVAGLRYELNSRYIVDTSDYIFVKDASLPLITKLLEQDVPGVEVETSFVREYNTSGAAHILGYINSMDETDVKRYRDKNYPLNAQVGKEGAELAFEEYLHGQDGTVAVTKTAEGAIVRREYTEPPQPGDNVYLTIDIVFQEAVERILASSIEKLQAERDIANAEYEELGMDKEIKPDITGGAIAAVDVKAGEPLAIASWPDFDLTTLLDNYTEVSTDEAKPLMNRALQGEYAPGSTFKPCTAIACLTEGIITTESTIEDEGKFTKYADAGYAPVCWAYSAGFKHGVVNVAQAIQVSCNYFFYTISDFVGNDDLSDYAARFGMGTATGIELPESLGVIGTQAYKLENIGADWYQGDTVQTGIGQGYSVYTPLQLAEYIAAVANSGEHHTASILKKVTSYDYGETVYERKPEVLSTVESEEKNYEAVRYGMYMVANTFEGSAYEAFRDCNLSVCAKTGTAQTGGGTNAIFVCFAPYEDPEIAVAIVVEKGSSGASIAFIGREVMEAYFSIKESNKTIESEMSFLR